MPDDERLQHVLGEIQRRGAIGGTSLPDAIAHARRYVAALPAGPLTLVDLGSGGGLPALVIVADRPDVTVVMVERRAKRADLLGYGIRALAASGRASAVLADVDEVIDDVATGARQPFDVVTARSFAPLPVVADVAHQLLRPGGLLLVSVRPGDAGVLDDRFTETAVADGLLRATRH